MFAADRKTPSFKRRLSNKVPSGSPDNPSRRSVSIPLLPLSLGPKKDIRELHSVFMNRIDARLASIVELKLPFASLYETKVLRYAFEHLSPKKLRDVYIKNGNVSHEILGLPTVTPRSTRFLGDISPLSLSQIRYLDLTATSYASHTLFSYSKI